MTDSAPKPEMLEKADAVLRGWDTRWPKAVGSILSGILDDLRERVALALVEAVREHDTANELAWALIEVADAKLRASEVETQNSLAGWRKANDRIREQMVKLDEAEASVESLRKERDKEHAEREEWRAATQRMTIMVQEQASALEAAHAEVTKAEHDRALNWAADFAANHSCDEHCECSDFIAADLRVAAGKYREPSSPTPPTSPRKEVVEWCGATCERSERSCLEAPYRCRGLKGHGGSHWTGNGVFWSSPEPEPNYASPTPPTEGPMEEESGPCCEDHYADRCNHGIYPKENCWNCFPSPEPPRGEPSK